VSKVGSLDPKNGLGGAAQSLATYGATATEMQQVSRWQSPSLPERCAQAHLAGRDTVARLREVRVWRRVDRPRAHRYSQSCKDGSSGSGG